VIGARREWRQTNRSLRPFLIDDLAAKHRHHRSYVPHVVDRDLKKVAVEYREIGKFAGLEGSDVTFP